MNLNVKKALPALTLASSLLTTLSAHGSQQYNNNGTTSANQQVTSFYPSASYVTHEGLNLSIYGDVLYLTAKEEGLEYAAVMDAPPTVFPFNGRVSAIADTSFHSVDFGWHLGYRLGAGYHSHHDYWDLSVEWMHYNQHDSSSLAPSQTTKTLFITNIMPVIPGVTFFNIAETAKEKWKMNFNTLDFNLMKSFWASRRLVVSPLLGIRAAWIDQKLTATYTTVFNTNNFGIIRATEIQNKNKNDFWGIGIRAGANTSWALTRRFSLFGNLSATPLLSFMNIKGKQTATGLTSAVTPPTSPAGVFVDMKNKFQTVKFNADMQLGAQWDCYFADNGYHLGFKAAWEYHYWPNQNQIGRTDDMSIVSNFTPNAIQIDHGDLSLYGVSFGVVFDF